VGVGSDNARGAFDNIRVQILPPRLTLDTTEDFSDGVANLFTGDASGTWSVNGGRYNALPNGTAGMSILDLGPDSLAVSSYLELNAKVNTASRAGFIFDRYGDTSFKFAAIDAVTDQVIIGHWTAKKGWAIDAVMAKTIDAGLDYTLGVTLKGATVSVTLNGQVVLGYAFNAATVDGNFGLMATGGAASFDDVRVKTDDPAFAAAGQALMAGGAPTESGTAAPLTETALGAMVEAATQRWETTAGTDAARLAGVHVAVADLSGSILGMAIGDTVFVDDDAAGYGWSVSGMDLLSVVEHELGHVLGWSHTSDGLMAPTLDAGERVVGESSTPASEPTWTASPTNGNGHHDREYSSLGLVDWSRAGGLDALVAGDHGSSVPASDFFARPVEFTLLPTNGNGTGTHNGNGNGNGHRAESTAIQGQVAWDPLNGKDRHGVDVVEFNIALEPETE